MARLRSLTTIGAGEATSIGTYLGEAGLGLSAWSAVSEDVLFVHVGMQPKEDDSSTVHCRAEIGKWHWLETKQAVLREAPHAWQS